MTKGTQDFEYLLSKPNVTGVEYDEDRDQVIVFVKKKVPESELPENAIISLQTPDGQDSDVREVDEISFQSDPTDRYRPIPAGVSEGLVDTQMAGTAGPLARVEDPESDYWRSDVEAGDLVRISNCHVYAQARERQGQFGDEICQPARLDGGTAADTVGEVVGYVPILDRMPVDCAARTTSGEEINDALDMNDVPRGVRRDYSGFSGERVGKSGRTTNTTTGTIQATSATMRVRVDEDRTATFRDQLVAGGMSDGGDSGSPLIDSDGKIAGLLFAGSSRVTLFNKIENVEDEFGVEMVTEDVDEPAPEPGDEPEEEPGGGVDSPPEPRAQTLEITSTMTAPTPEYSFAVPEGTTVDFEGRSTSRVGNRINGWTLGWTNCYEIGGYIESSAIPDGAKVYLNGERVDPGEVASRSKELSSDA